MENRSEKRVKCFTCKKKLGMFSFDCKCCHKFCAKHRFPELHNCEKMEEFKVLDTHETKRKNIISSYASNYSNAAY